MLFEREHPRLARVNCRHCWQWQYNEDTWEVEIDRRNGQPLRRVANIGPPCTMRRGCPKGHIDRQRTLWPSNARAYRHYLECSAVGAFPDDSLVRYHAGLLKQIEMIEQTQTLKLLQAVIGGRGGHRA